MTDDDKMKLMTEYHRTVAPIFSALSEGMARAAEDEFARQAQRYVPKEHPVVWPVGAKIPVTE